MEQAKETLGRNVVIVWLHDEGKAETLYDRAKQAVYRDLKGATQRSSQVLGRKSRTGLARSCVASESAPGAKEDDLRKKIQELHELDLVRCGVLTVRSR